VNLSPNFTLAELTFSQTAIDRGLDNSPDPDALANLERLAVTILQPIRDLVGCPVHVHDAYRAPAVNAAVGGVPDSQHQLGQAADIDALPDYTLKHLFDVIRQSTLPFDQVILEVTGTGGAVHVSCAAVGVAPRGQALVRSPEPPWHYTEARDAH
jgi:hypothetical protein